MKDINPGRENQRNGLEQIPGNRHSGASQLFFAPSPALRGVISHYTVQLRCDYEQAQGRPLTIIPDASGCLVFTVAGDAVEQCFWGPNVSTQDVERDFDKITLRLLVEFLPGGAFGLFGALPLSELQNNLYALDAIDPSLDRLFLPIVEQYHASYPELLRAVDAMLARRLGTVKKSGLISQVLATASAANGILRLHDLAGMTSYSGRHINRLCQERVGVSYKSLARILRVNEACRRINHGAESLTTLSYELGYFDQAHFTTDFKILCGVTPSVYQRNLSHFYNEETKLCVNLPGRYVQGG